MSQAEQSPRQRSEPVASTHIEEPPRSLGGIVSRLGPGLIIAGAIVGSGELVATTKTGAVAGFWLLWMIIIGCVIKVFAQVELGRYSISSGKATMTALDEVPGPRLRVNWIVWYYVATFLVALGQLGGIVGGVGQSMAMCMPITGDFNRLLAEQDVWTAEAEPIRLQLRRAEAANLTSADYDVREAAAARVKEQVAKQVGRPWPSRTTHDDAYWAAALTVITVLLLVNGRYGLIQNFAMAMVAVFTLVTMFNVLALQTQPAWAVHRSDLLNGLSFRLPPAVAGLTRSPLATALATFGIIGVGANELIAYPYWCLEKGYARFTGPRDETDAWAQRARGWMRVMRCDAAVSMVVYTFATLAFYVLGAAVLHRSGLDPEGNRMIHVLAQMYRPVFGAWATWLFLFGAFAVLYSTFFVSNAGHARIGADIVSVFGLGGRTERTQRWWIKFFCAIFPVISLAIYVLVRAPAQLILASGVMQAIMLPMLGFAAIYFRYRRCDPRITPGRLWDIMLWLCALGFLLAGGWLALTKLFPALERLG